MRIDKNSTYFMEVLLVDSTNNRVEGKNVYYKIYKSETNSLVEEGQLEDMGNGLYRKEYVFSQVGQFRIEYLLPEGWTDKVETVIVTESQTVLSDMRDMIKRILGLSQENYILVPLEYNRFLQLTKGRIKIYDTASDCISEINEKNSYYIEAEYDNEGKLIKYKVVREL